MFITFGNKTPFLYSMSLRTLFSGGLSLSSRLKLLTVLWVGSALLSVILTLILSLRLENAATVIDDAASLRMQVYRLAYMASERTPQAQIDNQLREFEGTLLRITQSDAIYPDAFGNTAGLWPDPIHALNRLEVKHPTRAETLPQTDADRTLPLCRQYRIVLAGIGKRQRKKHLMAAPFPNGDDADDFCRRRFNDRMALRLDYPSA